MLLLLIKSKHNLLAFPVFVYFFEKLSKWISRPTRKYYERTHIATYGTVVTQYALCISKLGCKLGYDIIIPQNAQGPEELVPHTIPRLTIVFVFVCVCILFFRTWMQSIQILSTVRARGTCWNPHPEAFRMEPVPARCNFRDLVPDFETLQTYRTRSVVARRRDQNGVLFVRLLKNSSINSEFGELFRRVVFDLQRKRIVDIFDFYQCVQR